MPRQFRLLLYIVALISLLAGNSYPVNAQTTSCPGAPPLRLQVGKPAHVRFIPDGEPATPVRVHDQPGVDSKSVGQLVENKTFQIIGGPVCQESFAWWQIQSGDLKGWIAEGTPDVYFVEPGDAPPPSTLPAASNGRQRITLANANRLSLVAKIKSDNLTQVRWSPDSSAVAVCCSEEGILHFKAGQWDKAPRAILLPDDLPSAVTFSPDGKTLGYGGQNAELIALDSGKSVKKFDTASWVGGMAFNASGTLLATITPNTDPAAKCPNTLAEVSVWDVATGRRLVQQPTCLSNYSALFIAVDAAGSLVALPDFNEDVGNIVQIWDVAANKEQAHIELGHMIEFTGMSFSPDSARLATVEGTGQVTLWDVRSGKRLDAFPAGESLDPATAAAFSPDGAVLATASRSEGLIVWALRGARKSVYVTNMPDTSIPLVDLAFSPDGTMLAAIQNSGDEHFLFVLAAAK